MSKLAKTFDTKWLGLKSCPDIPGWDPGRFVSNGLARLLIWINLRGVKLRIGLGRGVRYYNELEIRVRVRVRVRVMMGRT